MQTRKSIFNGGLNFILVVLMAGLFFATIITPSVRAAPSDIDFSFGSKVVDGFSIGKSLVQPDGKVLIAGGFDLIISQPQKYVIRLNIDGTRDSSFVSQAPGTIDDFVLQPDGKIVVVGRFSYGGSTCNSFNQCYGIMRLNDNGSYDATFKSGITPGGSQFVNTVILQPDGKFMIGGQFNSYSGQPYGLVARINADGSLDPTFQNPNVNNGGFSYSVNALALQTDGKVLIGGSFDTVGGQPRRSIARVNADGTLDTAFQATIPGTASSIVVNSIVVQPDGKILAGGRYTQPATGRNNGIVRLNADGSLDAAFQTPNYTDYSVSKILLQADGKIYLGGAFPAINNQTPTRGRLNANGTIDTTFSLFGINNLYCVTLQSNGRLLVIGTFTAPINNDTSIDYFIVREIALDGAVGAIAVQPDSKILIGGAFVSATGKTRKYLARLNQNGTLDATFPNLNIVSTASDVSISPITKIVVQADGKIIIIGTFSSVAGQTRTNLARLNSDGTIDSTFQVPMIAYPFSGSLTDVVLQPDNKILLGGYFNTVNSQNHKGIVRLNADGNVDATLQSNSFDLFAVTNIALQTDGKIIAVGNFQNTGANRKTIERLNADGLHDSTFQTVDVNQTAPNNGTVNVVRVQPDGKILIGGMFALINGRAHNFLARLNTDGTLDTTFQNLNFTGTNGITGGLTLQTDGKILVSGDFSTAGGLPRTGLTRINADGSVDTTFGNENLTYYPAKNALTVQRDGKILIGGSFQLVGNRVQLYISRLLGTPIGVPQNSAFDFDGDGKSDVSVFRPGNGAWYLQQSSAGFTGVTFGFGTDKLVPADFDGDGKTDIAVYRNGTWYLLRSSLGFTGVTFGDANDIPVPADYDGDGKADLAVFRPSNGTWYLLQSTNGFTGVAFGISTDKPVPADYDGDGKTDIAVNRSGTWYIQRSQLGFYGVQFGDGNDKLVPADYDGDGKADIAVFRPSNGVWYLQQSSAGFTGIAFGLGTDTPAPADYDGDGKADVAVFRSGTWYLNRSTAGFTGVAFGASTDNPLPNVFVR